MSTLHCPLCGLRFRFASELDEHAREEHAPKLRRVPGIRPAASDVPEPRPEHEPDHEPVLHLPW